MISPQALRALNTLVALSEPARIVDIGANPINPAPYDPLVDNGMATVWGFEPQPEAYAALKARETEHLRFLPYAIGDGGRHELRICKGSGFTSLLEPSQGFQNYVNHFKHKMQVSERVDIDTKRLDDLEELDRIDMVKIDIQGGETMVFDHAAQTLAGAVAVITEVAFIELYENQPLLDAQMQMMRAHGFVLHKLLSPISIPLRGPLQTPFGHERFRNQLVDSDAVFIRPIAPDTVLETQRVKTLAVLAAGVFDSLDVTLRCLDILVARDEITAKAATDWAKML